MQSPFVFTTLHTTFLKLLKPEKLPCYFSKCCQTLREATTSFTSAVSTTLNILKTIEKCTRIYLILPRMLESLAGCQTLFLFAVFL